MPLLRGFGLSFNKAILFSDYILGAYYVCGRIIERCSEPRRFLVVCLAVYCFARVGISAFTFLGIDKIGSGEDGTFEDTSSEQVLEDFLEQSRKEHADTWRRREERNQPNDQEAGQEKGKSRKSSKRKGKKSKKKQN